MRHNSKHSKKTRRKLVGAFVRNDTATAEPPAIVSNIQHITANVRTNLIRNDEMEGKKFLVVPMIMMVEGVHNGSNGPLLYPAEELSKTPEVWNHKPVVVYHPTINGKGVSACSPEVLTSHKIGVIMNTKFTKLGQLKAEAWLEEDRVKAVDERVWNALESKPPQTLELSTGLFTDNEEEEGEWNGEAYVAIARNYRADHLAVLPDKIGACSVADGAGFIRNQVIVNTGQNVPSAILEEIREHAIETIQNALKRKKWKGNKGLESLLANEMSHDNIRQQLSAMLREKHKSAAKDGYIPVWVEAVYDDFFVYELDGKLFKLGYKKTDTQIELEGEPSEVVRVTEYRSASGSFAGNEAHRITNNNTQIVMNKKQMVDGLIANHGWADADRAFLESQSEEVLSKMIANAEAQRKALAVNGSGNKPEDKKEKKDEALKPATNAAVSVEQFIESAPVEMRGALKAMHATHNERRQTLIASIKTNERNKLSDATLNAMDLADLEAVAALAQKPDAPAAQPAFNGLGHIVPATPTANSTKEEALVAPEMDFSRKS